MGLRSDLVNSVWPPVLQEFQDDYPYDILPEDTDELQPSDDDLGFVLGDYITCKTHLVHPSSANILKIWELFAENIDPLTKIVHTPTLAAEVEGFARQPRPVSRTLEALMFAIYSAAVMSTTDHYCQENFGESRMTLLSRFTGGAKIALSRANFLATNSLAVLQALALDIVSVRDLQEPRVIWTLTGIAIRIAQAMGVDRDDESSAQSPFHREIRCRIWWFLKTHELRTADLCGLPKFRDIISNRLSVRGPANVNDRQLAPNAFAHPKESLKPTDAIFIMFKYELAKFSFEYASGSGNNDNARTVRARNDIEEILETNYIRYCDPSQPLQLMTMVIVRIAINAVKFLHHHPRQWSHPQQVPMEERQIVWDVSLQLLEQHNMALSSPQLKRFAWHSAYYQQWYALIHVIDTLRRSPLLLDADKAWRIIGEVYENNPGMHSDTHVAINLAVGRFCLDAYGKRESALEAAGTDMQPTPMFISKLRQQQEKMLNKRLSFNQMAKSKLDFSDDAQVETAAMTRITRSQAETSPSHNTIPSSSVASLINPESSQEPFWSINRYDCGAPAPENLVEIDFDSIFGQDYSGEGITDSALAWQQWDAWLFQPNTQEPLLK
ncbi:Hypothetical protein R9X50_00470400 [Acrodontium crateriforme]|uniref:Xylanolytic transcriptional activator regulatory domain-containing protein n=1 Tax=Acrodontium crateriforme TaxID=150365 RepID=A0AAQ3M6P0_9PEZI|nr:Hypothetical protein R9X50_00470400 [Acrodontium crateriforme]